MLLATCYLLLLATTCYYLLLATDLATCHLLLATCYLLLARVPATCHLLLTLLATYQARVEIEAELQWAADGERAAPFALLRPMLGFHFDAMLPLYLLCTHTDDLLHAALFQCALLQPTRAGHPETCLCGLYLRMTEAALGLRELTQDPDEALVSPQMKEAHNGTVLKRPNPHP